MRSVLGGALGVLAAVAAVASGSAAHIGATARGGIALADVATAAPPTAFDGGPFDGGVSDDAVAVRQSGTPAARVAVPDLDGREVWPFDGAATAFVLVFIRSDCPVSNRYAPELARLHHDMEAQGVRFWMVYPGAQDRQAAHRHAAEYQVPGRPLMDPSMRLVDLAGVRVTPEAAVFDASRRLVYRGRIDDRYLDIGRARREATTFDVRDVLLALLAGGAAPYASRPAVGCYLDDLR